VKAPGLPRWPAGWPAPAWPAITAAGAAFLLALAVLIAVVTRGGPAHGQVPPPVITFRTDAPVATLSPYATFTMAPPSTAP
jgi:hypothetical protein